MLVSVVYLTKLKTEFTCCYASFRKQQRKQQSGWQYRSNDNSVGTTDVNNNTGNKQNPITGVSTPQIGCSSNVFMRIAETVVIPGVLTTITVISKRKRETK